MPNRETAAALERAADGLCYQSEMDAPWKPVDWPAAEGEPTGNEVRRRGRHRADAPVAEEEVDAFFAPLVQEQDWFGDEEKATAAQYQALFGAVKKLLRNPKVVRVGTRKVALYLVGAAPEGGWAGLKTAAVET